MERDDRTGPIFPARGSREKRRRAIPDGPAQVVPRPALNYTPRASHGRRVRPAEPSPSAHSMRSLTCPLLAAVAVACAGPTRSPQPSALEPESAPSAPLSSGTEPAAPTATATTAPATMPASEPTPAETETERLARLAREAIERGDFAGARALLDDLLTVPRVAEARDLLAKGRNEEALAVAAQALSVAPGEPRVLLVHAEANLRVGIANGVRERIDEARQSFLRAGTGAESWLGACRAAHELRQPSEALEYARLARTALAQARPLVAEPPERTLALAFARALDVAEANASATNDLRDETAAALAACVTALPSEDWAWKRLARVEEARGELAAAQSALERAFERNPRDADLPRELARVARLRGGGPEVIAAFERARAHAAGQVAVWWVPALERLEDIGRAPAERCAALRIAEGEFAVVRTLDGSLRADCLRNEAACRAGIGWARLEQGDLPGAAESFRSMEKLERGAMAIERPPLLRSGVAGLAALSAEHERRGSLADAAQLAYELHRYEPDEVTWALEAGRLYRAVAERSHAEAEELALASEGRIREPRRLLALRERTGIDATIPIGPRLQTEFRIRAEEQRKRARKQFENAYRSLLDASRLAPTHVRAMADAALIAIEYLNTDDEIARGLLRTAIALGERQLESPQLDEPARARLLQAWGDAHEYMGLLCLERDRDPRAAQGYFESALRIGPSARPSVQDLYLPRCREALQRRN